MHWFGTYNKTIIITSLQREYKHKLYAIEHACRCRLACYFIIRLSYIDTWNCENVEIEPYFTLSSFVLFRLVVIEPISRNILSRVIRWLATVFIFIYFVNYFYNDWLFYEATSRLAVVRDIKLFL